MCDPSTTLSQKHEFNDGNEYAILQDDVVLGAENMQ